MEQNPYKSSRNALGDDRQGAHERRKHIRTLLGLAIGLMVVMAICCGLLSRQHV